MRLTLLDKRGISIVEVLLVTAIISLLMGSIFYLLSVAESSRLVSIAKTEVQSEVRRAMDWIVSDVRQTTPASIINNLPPNPSTHIKFQKVIGYSVKGGIPSPDFGNFIEYTYDSGSKTITRTDPGNSPGSWTFNNIVIQLSDDITHVLVNHPIFNTRLLDGSIEPLTPVSLITERNLVVEIIGKKEVKLPLRTIDVVYLLKEEINTRN
ncbi:MAG: hypothetical protein ACYDFR_06210 [Candidatus Omnitrophota bacterium]